MHLANKHWWNRANKEFRSFFSGCRILEVGSYSENGSIRDFIDDDYAEYIGVDWRPGPCVDVISLAHEMFSESKKDEKFDAIISSSMLEHDPHWRESILRMCELLADDGVLVLTWGNIHNLLHELDTAPDGKFHPLLTKNVRDLLKELNMHIHISAYPSELGFTEGVLLGYAPGLLEIYEFSEFEIALMEYYFRQDNRYLKLVEYFTNKEIQMTEICIAWKQFHNELIDSMKRDIDFHLVPESWHRASMLFHYVSPRNSHTRIIEILTDYVDNHCEFPQAESIIVAFKNKSHVPPDSKQVIGKINETTRAVRNTLYE
jgi:SAM-dependent methyltransferase